MIARIDNVRATGFVDEVVVEDHIGQKIEDIKKFNIDVFAVGSDWTGKFDYLKEYCDVVYLERTRNVSATMRRIGDNAIVKIGIVGIGREAGKFPQEAKYVSGVTVAGAYDPHGEDAKEFADRFELSFGEDDYGRFLDKVDAVYIVSPHGEYYEYVKAALKHKKHVLCEKPMVFQRAQAEELFALSKEQGCVLMEAIKTAYSPGFNQLVMVAKSGVIGEIRDVEASYSRLLDPALREMVDAQYGGAFTEFGSYVLLPILKLLGRDYKEVRFDSIKAESGIDVYTKASFVFDNGLALTKAGSGVKTEGQLMVAGTKGYILAKSPWWLTQSFEVRFEDSNKKEIYSSRFMGKGLRYEISDFVRAIMGDRNREYKLTRGDSIAMAGIMEKFLKTRNEPELFTEHLLES